MVETPRPRWTFRRPSVIPGFGITLGTTLLWLSVIVLIPLAALFLRTTELSFQRLVAIVTSPRALHALALSFGLSVAALIICVSSIPR